MKTTVERITPKIKTFRSSLALDVNIDTGHGDLIKSRDRVKQFAEVYTATTQVNDMLDELDTKDTNFVISQIDSKVLEPACGNGNFLDQILIRKLSTIADIIKDDKKSIRLNTVIAISSLYGVDIQKDNVVETKARLLATVERFFATLSITGPHAAKVLNVIIHILNLNIQHGNTLTSTKGAGKQPLVMAEWSFNAKGLATRKNFRYDSLTEDKPEPRKVFKPIHYTKLGVK